METIVRYNRDDFLDSDVYEAVTDSVTIYDRISDIILFTNYENFEILNLKLNILDL